MAEPMSSSVIVTGSSSGFGELTVRTLAAAGHRVFATMRDVDSRNAPAAERVLAWGRAHGYEVHVVDLDVLREDSVNTAVQQIVDLSARIDVVVNNAGVGTQGPIEAFSMEQIERQFSLNAFGPIRVCKAVLPTMRAQGSGLLVFVTSTLARVLARGGLYAATKWAEEGLAESLCYQVAPFGIDVAIVEPGSFPTPVHGKTWRAEHQDIVAAYDAATPRSAPVPPPSEGYRPPDPQEVAASIKTLVDLPPGSRPLRTVVGPVYTEGIAEYNAEYLRVRAHMIDVLRRPDQHTNWAHR